MYLTALLSKNPASPSTHPLNVEMPTPGHTKCAYSAEMDLFLLCKYANVVFGAYQEY
jgi:hypothetical protein